MSSCCGLTEPVNNMHDQQKKKKKKSGAKAAGRFLWQCAALLVAFHGGFYMGYHQGSKQSSRYLLSSTMYEGNEPQTIPPSVPEEQVYSKKDVDEMVEQRMALFTKLREKVEKRAEQLPKADRIVVKKKARRRRLKRVRNSAHLPTETQSFAAAMSLVDRNEFAQQFDIGVPLDPSTKHNSQVLLLHAKDAVPDAAHSNDFFREVPDAVQNCNHLSLILTQQSRPDQCVAIMGQYNSYHVHRFMRTKDKEGIRVIDPELPLRLVPRGADTRHSFATKTPSVSTTRHYWNSTLRSYFTHLDSYLAELEPILKRVALCNSVVVMVCNLGQSDLMKNFVCNAKAKGLDLSGILLFATDVETAEIAKGLGLETYYDERLFGRIPQQQAKGFGDATYTQTIISKVYCVQLVSMLGYHVLFSDIDMVWFRDPLEYFQSNKTATDVDIFMQHDGNHAQFYAPYSGNTGLYYVRNTPRTQYFLNSLLVSGDLIAATRTHQAPFLSLLSEHASLHGLRVQILEDYKFPGGMQFQNHRRYMRHFLEVTAAGGHQEDLPYVFHMSWSANRDRKVEFFQQLGEFHVNDHCLSGGDASEGILHGKDILSECCSAKPIIKCHYSDKPSRVPCRSSPPFENGKQSFW